MANVADCPNCRESIDATQAALNRECPECQTSYTTLVRMTEPENDPKDAGPYHQYE